MKTAELIREHGSTLIEVTITDGPGAGKYISGINIHDGLLDMGDANSIR